MPVIPDIIMPFAQRDPGGRVREHATVDGLQTFCGLTVFDMQPPGIGTLCVRCKRAAEAGREVPLPTVPGPPTAVQALVQFLAEAIAELEGHAASRGFYDAFTSRDYEFAERLVALHPTLRSFDAKRLVALSVQLIKGRRSIRELQSLRQALVYGL